MTDWSTAQHVGPGGEEAEKRKQAALASRAERAAAEQAKIEAFIDGTGPDPETGLAISSPKATAADEAPKPDPKAVLLAKLAMAKDKLEKLRRRKK